MKTKNNKIIICERSRKFLYLMCIWPKDNELNPEKIYYFRLFLFFLVTGITAYFFIMHLVITIRDNLDLPLAETVAVLSSMFGIYYIIFTFLLKRTEIILLLRDLSDFTKFGLPPNYKEEQNILSMIVNFNLIYSISATSVYAFYKYSHKSKCELINLQQNLNQICGFITNVWIPININNVVTYWFLFLFVYMGCMWIFTPPLIIFTLNFEMVKNIILKINHLNLMLSQCFHLSDYNVCKKQLIWCIQYHSDILNFASRLDACFSNCMFAHLILTSSIVAFLQYQFLKGDKICAFLHMAGWIISLLLACISGQIFLNASDTISEAVWFSNWPQSDVRLKKDLQFLLARSQRKLKITAGGFGILSFPLFISVIKMSYSVLCVLRS